MKKRIVITLFGVVATQFLFANVVANEQGKCGYKDETGNLIIDYQYDFIGTFDSTGVALMKKNGKFGMISITGEEVLPAKYTWISTPDEYGFRAIQSGKKYGMVAANGTVTMPTRFSAVPKFNKYGLALVPSSIVSGYYDLINKSGKRLTMVQWNMGCFTSKHNYDRRPFTPSGANWTSVGDLDFVLRQDAEVLYDPFQRYMINTSGYLTCYGGTQKVNELMKITKPFPSTYPCIHDKSKPIVKYRLPNGLEYQDYVGQKWWNVFQFLEQPSDGIIKFVEGCGYGVDSIQITLGYYDFVHDTIVAQYSYNQHKSCLNVENTQGEVWNSSCYATLAKYLSFTGSQIIEKIEDDGNYISGTSFHSGYAIIYYHGSTGNGVDIINTKGEKIAHFADCYRMNDGYFVMEDENGNGGIIDSLGQVMIPCQYPYYVTSFRFDKWWVQKSKKGKWGAVNIQGEEVVPFAYDSITSWKNGNICMVYKAGKVGLYSHITQVLDCVYDSITSWWGDANGGYAAIAYKNGEGRMYNFENKKVSPPFVGERGYWESSDVDVIHKKAYRVFNIVKGDTLYGYVDTNADMFIPTVIDDPTDAINAYSRYKKIPTQQFTDEGIRCLKLYSKQYLQKYSLDATLPQDEWDY